MATTWAELKLLVKSKLRYDGSSVEDINDLAINSGFDTRAKKCFSAFVEDACAIYEDRAALTLAQADKTIDLFDIAKSAKPIFAPRYVWVNNIRLEQYSMSDLETLYSSGSLSQGTPVAWAIAEDGRVTFDKPLSGAFANNFASGFCRHAAITADTDTLRVPDRLVTDIIPAYIAANFQQGVVGSNIGLNRLEMYDKIAYNGLMQFRATQTARFFGGIGVSGLR